MSVPRKAVAYYRCAGGADDVDDPLDLQRLQVRVYAYKNSIEIVKEFADRHKSGLSTEGRDGLNHMLGSYVIGKAEPFDCILVADMARLARCEHLLEYCMRLIKANGKCIIFVATEPPPSRKRKK